MPDVQRHDEGTRVNMGAIVRAAERQGWRVEKARRRGHMKFTSPSGQPVFCSGTPSDGYRGIRNLLAMLRRCGLEFPR